MATLFENANRIANALEDIKNAIIRKGQTPTGRCETFSEAIDNIQGGVDTSQDTVSADKLLNGITAHDKNGNQIVGNIAEISQGDAVIYKKNTELEFEQGYYPNTFKVSVDDMTKASTVPENIKDGVEILGIVGRFKGNIAYGSKSLSTTAQTVIDDVGFYPSIIIAELCNTSNVCVAVNVYVKEWGSGKAYLGYGSTASQEYQIPSTSNIRINSLTDNGFIMNKTGSATYATVRYFCME